MGDGLKHRDILVRLSTGMIKVHCACGTWEASSKFSSVRGAIQAWNGHMYARGFRTAESVIAAKLEEPKETDD